MRLHRIKTALEKVKDDLIGQFGYPKMTVEDFYENVRSHDNFISR